jgi:hypothetical protein
MNRIVRFATSAILISAASFAQQPTVDKAPPGRYQLVPAVVEGAIASGQATEHCLFLIDTKTGQVWKLQTGGVVKNLNGVPGETYVPDSFLPVKFGSEIGTNGPFVPTPAK